jgi:hypothetical protein
MAAGPGGRLSPAQPKRRRNSELADSSLASPLGEIEVVELSMGLTHAISRCRVLLFASGAKAAFHFGELAGGEQVIDHIRDAGRLPLGSRQRDSASRHSTSVDGCNVVTAGLAIAGAVDPAAERVGDERAINDQLFWLRRSELGPGREHYLVVRGAVDRRRHRDRRSQLVRLARQRWHSLVEFSRRRRLLPRRCQPGPRQEGSGPHRRRVSSRFQADYQRITKRAITVGPLVSCDVCNACFE